MKLDTSLEKDDRKLENRKEKLENSRKIRIKLSDSVEIGAYKLICKCGKFTEIRRTRKVLKFCKNKESSIVVLREIIY